MFFLPCLNSFRIIKLHLLCISSYLCFSRLLFSFFIIVPVSTSYNDFRLSMPFLSSLSISLCHLCYVLSLSKLLYLRRSFLASMFHRPYISNCLVFLFFTSSFDLMVLKSRVLKSGERIYLIFLISLIQLLIPLERFLPIFSIFALIVLISMLLKSNDLICLAFLISFIQF